MTKEEFAQQYAEEKAAEMAKLLKAAYLKGYEQGELKVACSISIEGVEYYDHGLPSGTLWSKPIRFTSPSCPGYKKFSHNDASRFDGLPTEAQWEELKKCRIYDDYIIGCSGMRIYIDTSRSNYLDYRGEVDYRGENAPEGYNYFWLKSEMDEKGVAKAGSFNANGLSIVSHFAGYKLPIMLTKKREEI